MSTDHFTLFEIVRELAQGHINGELVKDCDGRPLDEAYFEGWRLRVQSLPKAHQSLAGDPSIFYLKRQGVQLVVKRGDQLEVKTKWAKAGPRVGVLSAALVGYVEEIK